MRINPVKSRLAVFFSHNKPRDPFNIFVPIATVRSHLYIHKLETKKKSLLMTRKKI
jgi:hypothetical protein